VSGWLRTSLGFFRSSWGPTVAVARLLERRCWYLQKTEPASPVLRRGQSLSTLARHRPGELPRMAPPCGICGLTVKHCFGTTIAQKSYRRMAQLRRADGVAPSVTIPGARMPQSGHLRDICKLEGRISGVHRASRLQAVAAQLLPRHSQAAVSCGRIAGCYCVVHFIVVQQTVKG